MVTTMAAHRVEVIRRQLCSAVKNDSASLDTSLNSVPNLSTLSNPGAGPMLSNWNSYEDRGEQGPNAEVSHLMPGPLHDIGSGKRFESKKDILRLLLDAAAEGRNHEVWVEFGERYGKDGSLSNIAVPQLVFSRDELTGKRIAPYITTLVQISNPSDAARIARAHVQKQGNFTTFLLGSLLSTQSVENWKHQRQEFVRAFMPLASLRKVFPISVARASSCAERLLSLAQRGRSGSAGGVVDLNEFFLHETQAQLQLALFGEDEGFMERTNKKFRDGLAGLDGSRGAEDGMMAFLRSVVRRARDPARTAPVCTEAGGPELPVRGPLSAVLNEVNDVRAAHAARPNDVNANTKVGNAMIFEFAGHDTTGHTLTWLLLELARHPEHQRALQAEVDAFWERNGSVSDYMQLVELPFMTRCIVETLRLWNVVPQGTFRVLQYADYVKVGDGEVRLPKGTHVQIDRDFRGNELWYGDPFRAYNPHSERFAPFTHPPRDCIGKNFAQMEMRTILLHLLRRFDFELAEPHRSWLERHPGAAGARLGANLGTPVDAHAVAVERHALTV